MRFAPMRTFRFIISLFCLVWVQLICCQSTAIAREPIKDFKISPSLFETTSIHIQALDELGNEDLTIKGRYLFQINGFEKKLTFVGGKAEYPDSLKSSTFLYMKWAGAEKMVPRLFFVYRSAAGLVPVKISLFWLLAFPIALMLFSFVFKKLLFIAVIILILFFFLNKGLSVSNYATALKDWVISHG